MRSCNSDNCCASFYNCDVTIRIYCNCITTYYFITEYAVADGNFSINLQAGITIGSSNIICLNCLRFPKRFENCECSGVNFHNIIVRIVSHCHCDDVCTLCFTFLAGNTIIEIFALNDATLIYINYTRKCNNCKCWIRLSYSAIGCEYDVVDCKEVAVFIRAIILFIIPSKGMITCRQIT